ncbi:MAG: hypothetical protein AAF927_05835 [Bacteroidota bacterium]
MKHLLIILTLLGAAIPLSAQEKSIPQQQIGLWGGIGVGQYINLLEPRYSFLGYRRVLWSINANYDLQIKQSNWWLRYDATFSKRPAPAISAKFHYLSSALNVLYRSKRNFMIGMGLQISGVRAPYRDNSSIPNNRFTLDLPLTLEKQFRLTEHLSVHTTLKLDIALTSILPRYCSDLRGRSFCFHYFSESAFAGVGLKYDLGR